MDEIIDHSSIKSSDQCQDGADANREQLRYHARHTTTPKGFTMKKSLLCALMLSAFSLGASAADPKIETQAQKLGYAVGIQMGVSLQREGIEPDLDALYLGIRDAMEGKRNNFV